MNEHPQSFGLIRRVVSTLAKAAALVCLGGAALLCGCQSRFIYFPRPYGPDQVNRWDAESGTTVIRYHTQDGDQQAYLLSRAAKPERLWIVCGGNGTVALEWSDWLREHGPAEDAWLLIDMPGYGACEGSPSPASIRRNLKAVVPAAMASLDWSLPADREKLRFFGHSLGSAVSLMASSEYGIQRGVLLTPFTSTMDMAGVVTGLPIGWLVWHRFDNRARIQELTARGEGAVYVFHGSDDEALPVEMSRELAAKFPGVVHYTEIPRGRHNTLQDSDPDKISTALRNARKNP